MGAQASRGFSGSRSSNGDFLIHLSSRASRPSPESMMVSRGREHLGGRARGPCGVPAHSCTHLSVGADCEHPVRAAWITPTMSRAASRPTSGVSRSVSTLVEERQVRVGRYRDSRREAARDEYHPQQDQTPDGWVPANPAWIRRSTFARTRLDFEGAALEEEVSARSPRIAVTPVQSHDGW